MGRWRRGDGGPAAAVTGYARVRGVEEVDVSQANPVSIVAVTQSGLWRGALWL
ncbi:MAG: hypothetical protein R3B70_37320 [Polyangiaceae bacterium]